MTEATRTKPFLETALSAIQDYVYSFDKEGRFLFANKALLDLWGLSEEEVVGKTMADLRYPKEVEAKLLEGIKRVLASGQSVRNETTHPGGGSGFYENILSPVFSEDGRVLFVTGSARDVSERKRAEARLNEQNILLETLTESVLDGILVVSPEGEMRYFNRQFLSIWNFPEEVIASGSDARALSWAAAQTTDPEGFSRRVTEVYAHPDEKVREEVTLKDGRVYERFGTAIHAGGKYLGWVWTFRDISERKVTEQALSEQLELTNTITSNATQAIFMMDAAGYCTFMNPAAETMLGFSFEEIRLRPLHDMIHHHHPDGRPYPMHECPIDRALPENFDIREHEDTFIRKNGEFFPVLVAASPIFRDGKPVSTVIEVRDITERKKVEGALQESEARFRQLANSLPQIVYATTSGGATLEFINDTWLEYTGQSLEEALGGKANEPLHPEDRERTVKLWQVSFQDNRAYEDEIRIRSRTGEYRWFLTRSLPIKNGAGEVVRWIGTSTDIHERKLSEERLSFLLSLNALVQELAGAKEIETLITRKVAERLRADRCYFTRVDVKEDALHIKTDWHQRDLSSMAGDYHLSDFVLPEFARASKAGQTTVIHDITTHPVTAPFAVTFQTLSIGSSIAVPMLKGGQWVGMLVLNTRQPRRWQSHEVELAESVARQFLPVIERAEAEEKVRESEDRFRNMADHAPVMVWITEPAGRCSFLSQSWYEFTGQTPETGLGFGWLNATHPEDRETSENIFLAANANQRAFSLEYRLRHKDGSYRWAIDSAQPRFGKDGEFLGYIGSVLDISERKRAEETLREANEQLRVLNEQQKRFVADAAHELRAPLTSIQGNLQLLNQYKPVDPSLQAEMLGDVQRESERLGRLVNDLLAIARGDSGLKLEKKSLPLEQVLLEAWRSASALTTQHQLHLGALPRVEVLGNRDRLKQLALILLENAIKYTPAGGCITMGLEADKEKVRLYVSDTGIGIGQEDLPHVFERFYRADKARTPHKETSGTGLGLSIAEWIVKQHEGKIWLESEPGKGTTAWLELPLY
jgi:PAS domain S-box-containing protein